MINPTESQERQFHQAIAEKIADELTAVIDNIAARHHEMMEIKEQIQEHARDLDHVDKANLRQAADMASRVGEHSVEQQQRLSRMLKSPYFGRIDVATDNQENNRSHAVYIGVHSFAEADCPQPLVHDWRAPISSMFYDFELGAAHYVAPQGRIDAEISLKRQYKIEDRQFRFMIESALNIQDDILQEALSRASDDKLKNIVATIQRDQNAIIRDEQAHSLIIQGAAGSGKTSIALHRIAYLLYKHKDTIASDDILIISPNKVFAHYISQVLPELGEEMIRETTMEQLADELLDGDFDFQTFAEQVSKLLDGRDEAFAERVRFKATAEFLEELDAYINQFRSTNLRTKGLRIGIHTMDSNWLSMQFRKRARFSVADQLNGVVNAVVERMKYEFMEEIKGTERARVRKELKQMFADTKLKTIYKNFYQYLQCPEMFKQGSSGKLEYSDVFPLICLKMGIEGMASFSEIKHVVIDEMQDYTPVQYQVIRELYPARMTILGDRNQSVNPYSSSSAESIAKILPDAHCVYMQKSYRSTIQITRLAQSIIHNPDLVPIERQGEPPRMKIFTTKKKELDFLLDETRRFNQNDYRSLGIICKTQRMAESVYAHLQAEANVRIIDTDSESFSDGVLITTAYLAKGLEFDEILVPHCTAKEYQAEIDRYMLYVAVTRAMHRLTITSHGEFSEFLRPDVK